MSELQEKETLTAEERAACEEFAGSRFAVQYTGPVFALLVAYDDALARAEAAEKLSGERYMATCDWCQKASDAESRLAAAVELLQTCWNERRPPLYAELKDKPIRYEISCGQMLPVESATAPAPAAESEPHFACATELGASLVALRECKELLRGCWRGALSTDRSRSIFQWFKAQGEDLNEPAAESEE